MIKYETPRLILREWLDDDFDNYLALNQDADVMQYFPKTLSHEETLALVPKLKKSFNEHGFGFYTCELKETKEFVGRIGLGIPDFEAHFTPCVEVGWRIAKKFWGQGLAVEAALKCFEIGFTQFNLNEIVAFTTKTNKKSEKVMQKLGMTHTPEDDFYHPKLEKSSPLALHVLYRMANSITYTHRL